MSLHVFASFVTPFGTAANNRGETEGNMTTLQKLLWQGESYTTVSAEAIRFALRRRFGEMDPAGTNRRWDEASRSNVWEDHQFKAWASEKGKTFIDDDLLGFMIAEAAKEETDGGETKGKGTANVRRAVLEVTRAVSLTPWAGDVTFNAASPGATPSASKGDKNKAKNPVPYGAELHATRYQYGIALTPERLRDPSRAAKALEGLCTVGPVAGNHGRFFFDFSPESIVIRITDDPAPRILYCFGTDDDGRTVHAKALEQKIQLGDIKNDELIMGGAITLGGEKIRGVKEACEQAISIINKRITAKG
ncbi:MAG: type I-B CRISPR-associated protein Cas7/Cst2/DevR [Planctomycetota bacterium]|nr:MAG: type I-B CRISPR-associated protein Cas7/Cst2/DevR [Planctomycetota bacterium]